MNIACTDMDPEAVLDVLVSMKGLKELAVCEVKLNSLNGLETLPELETLNVWGMDEPQDLHPIAAMPELKRMTVGTLTENMLQVLVQSGVTDLEVTHAGSISLSRMTEMSHLEKLYFYSDNRAIVESEPLSFPVLRWADLKNLKFRSLACVQGMPNLEELFIYASECLSYEGLEGAQNLKYIYCTAEQGEALRAMYPDAEWEIVD